MELTCRAVLFDLDGTLVDSTAPIERVWHAWSERHAIPFEALVGVMHGRRAVETIRLVAPHLVPEQELDALELDEIAHMDEAVVFPGAIELLRTLDSLPWAIVTSGSRRVAEARLGRMCLPRPVVVVTADDISAGKPSPEGYLLAAARLAVPVRDCVVIEDSPVGVQAATAAGMPVIAVVSTHEPDDLRAADAVVSRLTDIRLHADQSGIHLDLSG